MAKNYKTNVAIQQTTISTGPIPTPDALAKYESIKPGITDIFLKTYQDQVNHRIEVENKVVNNNNDLSQKGQKYAFIICLVAIILGFILILFDKNIIGLISIVTPLISMVSVFIYGKNNEKKERIEKAKIVPDIK